MSFALDSSGTAVARRAWLADAARLGLLLGGLGLWPVPGRADAAGDAAFKARDLTSIVRAWGPATPVPSATVSLTAPEIAENGANVPIALATTEAQARRLLLVVEKNPSPLVSAFELGEFVEPSFSLRIKMAETSAVYAVALLADGRALYARRDVSVVLGGCGI